MSPVGSLCILHCPAGWPKSLYSHLQLRGLLARHTGCVNSVYWHSAGHLLSSGSDDTMLCLWSYPACALVASVPTNHTANIFGTKFLPNTNRIVTVAGDGETRVFEAADAELKLQRVFSCNRGRVKKSDAEAGNPDVFVTASEDGKTRDRRKLKGPSACLTCGSRTSAPTTA